MSDLRETVIEEVMVAFDYMEMEPIAGEIADRILATVFDALQSPEVVEAMYQSLGVDHDDLRTVVQAAIAALRDGTTGEETTA